MENSEVNNVIETYKEVTILCGTNYDRQDLIDVSNKIEIDKDLLNVIHFKRRFLFLYNVFWILFVLTPIFALLSFAGGFIQKDISLPLVGRIDVINLRFVFIAISFFGLLFDLITRIMQKSSLDKAIKNILEDNKRNSKEQIINIEKITIGKFARLLRCKNIPKSPNAWWRPQQGHISDAQIFKSIDHAFMYNVTNAEKKNVNLIYSGIPYFFNEYVDSIYIKVKYNKEGIYAYFEKLRIGRLLKNALRSHIVSFLLGNTMQDKKYDNFAQLNTSHYIFGILYLSKCLKSIYETWSCRTKSINGRSNIKINFDLESMLCTNNDEHKRVLEFLLKAASTMDYFCFNNRDTKIPVIEVVDISTFNESRTDRRLQKERRSCLRIPIKRPISLPSK